MTNKEISRLLRNVAASYSITNDAKYKFQIIAYQKAADAIESSTQEVKDLYSEKQLESISGVGPSIRAHLEELIAKGVSSHFVTVMKDVPQAMFPLLDIPSFGPKKAHKLVTHFKLTDPKTVVTDLEALAKSGKIATLEGFGEKSEADILQAIAEFHKGKDKHVRMSLPFAAKLADELTVYLKKSPHVEEVHPLGSLRRSRDTIGDIDFAVVTDDSASTIAHFAAYPYAERVIQKGENDASILVSNGVRVDMRVQNRKSFGALLQHFTGSKNHNIHLRAVAQKKGLSLSEYGIKHEKTGKIKEFSSEVSFYNSLGMDWIPPEMREDTGEIELSLRKSLPKLVTLDDMAGDFHLHSNFPIQPSHDLGKHTILAMAKKAKDLKYSYLGFSEHNPSASMHTEDETLDLITKRNKEIEQAESTLNIRVFKLLETDILASGKLGLHESSLHVLDGSIVSIHSAFSMGKEAMTKRIIQGLSHKKAKILAHPTGRLINERNGFDVDWETLFAFCVKNNKALEINASPYRLDLPDEIIKPAVEAGVVFFINTDSHSLPEMDLMRYGVSIARRGWATKEQIVNTWPLSKIEKWFAT